MAPLGCVCLVLLLKRQLHTSHHVNSFSLPSNRRDNNGCPGWIAMVHTCNPSTQEVEVEGQECKGHPQLGSEMEASLRCVRPCLRDSWVAQGPIHT